MVGVLLGGIGVVLATPLAAAASVLVRSLYLDGVLGDSSADGADGHAAALGRNGGIWVVPVTGTDAR
jgi:hypothetical protein